MCLKKQQKKNDVGTGKSDADRSIYDDIFSSAKIEFHLLYFSKVAY